MSETTADRPDPADTQPASISLGLATHLSWRLNLSEDEARGIVEEVIGEFWEFDLYNGSDAYDHCESPAERLYLLGFRMGRPGWIDFNDPPRVKFKVAGNPVGGVGRLGNEADLYQQVEIGSYRVDFLFRVRRDRWVDFSTLLVVEIDGHDFHERTKEQASADRSRDRFFMRSGISVIRFTGSEVYRSPTRCAEETIDMLDHMIIAHDKATRRDSENALHETDPETNPPPRSANVPELAEHQEAAE